MLGKMGIALGAMGGILLGLGAFTFGYGEGWSYMSPDPRACTNCHIMQPYFDSWQKSSHHTVSRCVDCHLPHDFIGKYIAKADNGFRHSWAFTFQNFHEPIQIIDRNSRILQKNCLACHEGLVHALAPGQAKTEETMRCVHCHGDVGHGD